MLNLVQTGLYIYEQVPWSPRERPLDLLNPGKLQPSGFGHFLFVYYFTRARPHQLTSDPREKKIHLFHLLYPFHNYGPQGQIHHHMKAKLNLHQLQPYHQALPMQSMISEWHRTLLTTYHFTYTKWFSLRVMPSRSVTWAQVLRRVQFRRPWLYCSSAFKRQISMTNLWFDLKRTAPGESGYLAYYPDKLSDLK